MSIQVRLFFAHLLSILLLPVWIFPIVLMGCFVWFEYVNDDVNWQNGNIRNFWGWLFLAAFEMLAIYSVVNLMVRYAH